MTPSTLSRSRSSSIWVIVLSFAVLMAEGFDLAMFGSVLPSLRADADLGITPEMAGYLGSAGVFGMLVGAALTAFLADRYGRRVVTIAAVTIFSSGMLLSAFAGNAEVLLALRLIVGIGAGAVMPTCAATLLEFAPQHRKALWMAIGFSAVGLGGVLSGVMSLFLADDYGWQSMFLLGGLFLILTPFLLWRFPESVSFLLASGRTEGARDVAQRHGLSIEGFAQTDSANSSDDKAEDKPEKSRLKDVFGEGRLLGTLLFWIATSVCLLVNFGVAAWLPDLLNGAGYPLSIALGSMVVLKTGAIIGTLFGGWLADTFGQKRVVLCIYMLTAVSLLLLALRPSVAIAYLLIACLGMGTTGLQTLINAYVGSYYPARVRATALGLNLSIGRIGGILGPTYLGFLVAGGITFAGKFYALAIPAIIGAIIIAFVPTSRAKAPQATGASEPEDNTEVVMDAPKA